MSDPRVVAALKPYIITAWSGHRGDADLPDIVRELWARKFQQGRGEKAIRQSNVDIAMLAPSGQMIHSFDAIGDASYGRPADLVNRTLGQIRRATSRLPSGLPRASATRPALLRLPDAAVGKSGLRVFVKFDDHLMPAYRRPVVEFVPLARRDWLSLSWPEKRRDVDASLLTKWLSQVYPPGVMERVDKVTKQPFAITRVTGTLSLSPHTPYAGERYAVASGKVRLEDSSDDNFFFEGTLDLVLTYTRNDPEVQTVKGVFRGLYPRSDRRRGTTRRIPLDAVFESRPR